MDYEDSKKELLSYLKHRTLNIIRDANTFLWAKTRHHETFHEGPEWNSLGGGNILVAIGLIATLNYLAKIHWLLGGHNIEDDGTIVEKHAFNLLLTDYPADTGLTSHDEIDEIYELSRDRLVHMLAPKEGGLQILSLGPSESKYEDEWKGYMNSKDPSFIFGGDNGLVRCQTELLIRDAISICESIYEKVSNDEYSATTESTLKWIMAQLGHNV
jgi:hypothetical protein